MHAVLAWMCEHCCKQWKQADRQKMKCTLSLHVAYPTPFVSVLASHLVSEKWLAMTWRGRFAQQSSHLCWLNKSALFMLNIIILARSFLTFSLDVLVSPAWPAVFSLSSAFLKSSYHRVWPIGHTWVILPQQPLVESTRTDSKSRDHPMIAMLKA